MNNIEIEVEREGKWVRAKPEELTNDELCDTLNGIQIDSDEFIPQHEIDQGYAAIEEAIRRLRNDETWG